MDIDGFSLDNEYINNARPCVPPVTNSSGFKIKLKLSAAINNKMAKYMYFFIMPPLIIV